MIYKYIKYMYASCSSLFIRKKNNNLCFRPGPIQTGLYSHRSRLDACNFRFKKKRNCIIRVAKTKALISGAVTAHVICVFVFAHASRLWPGASYSICSVVTRNPVRYTIPTASCLINNNYLEDAGGWKSMSRCPNGSFATAYAMQVYF